MTKFTSSILTKLSKHRLLIIALIVSLLTHFMLLNSFSINIPLPDYKKQTLNVSLSNSESKQNTTLPTTKILQQSNVASTDTSANKLNSAEIKESHLPPEQDNNSLELNQSASLIEDTTELTTKAIQNTQNSQTEQVSTTKQLTELVASTEPNTEASTTTTAISPTYKYIEADYSVLNNDIYSTTRVSFNIDKNGSYILSALHIYRDSENILIKTNSEKSEGTVNEQGLTPGYYASQEGNDISKTQSTSFAWQDGFIKLQKENQTKAVPLLRGTQDPLSFQYQMMFYPSIKSIVVPITNDTQINIYTYKLINEEILETKLGKLNTLHFQSLDYDEKSDIWLALDYQYFPVQVNHIDKHGSTRQQKILSISTIEK